MRRLLLAAAVVFIALAGPKALAANTQNVGIASSSFRNGVCPQPNGTNIARIKAGDTVKWTNCDGFDHNITWKQDYELPNRTLQEAGMAGDTTSLTFSRAGFFDYYCSIHGSPSSDNMQGRVVVESAQPSTTKATAPAPTTTMATVPPTTATTVPSTTIDLDGVFATSSTIPEPTTTTTTTTPVDDLALESQDGGANPALVALLVAGIGAAIGGGIYLVRRMQTGV